MRLLIHDYAGHPFQAQLSRELARRNHAVTHAYAGNLLTPRGALKQKAGDSQCLCFSEVPMSPDYRAHKYSFRKRRGYEVAYGAELANLVREVRPDVIISGNTPTEPQWEMIRTARHLRMPVVSWVQDFYSVAVDRLARKKLLVLGALAGHWYRHLDGKCLRASAAIVSITEDFLPVLARFGVARERISVIPNWAPLEDLPLRPRQNRWSTRHDLNAKFVFQYSGTLAMKHNPDLLRQLAVRFRNEASVRVVVISEGPGADYLRARKVREHLDNLQLLPFQDFSEMPETLATADVLVAVLEPDAGVFSVPSKILTYHCAGRPILAAMPLENLAAKIMLGQATGICVAPDDLSGFLRGADSLWKSPKVRERYAASARRYAEAHFDITSIADRFENILRQASL